MKLRNWARRARLDADLAAGSDPATSSRHELRAAQLGSPELRSQLANRLVAAVGSARRQGQELISARRRRAREEVFHRADDLLALAARLRDAEPLPVRGLAMIARLVEDRRSPLYRAGDEDLGDALRSAHDALGGRAPEHELRAAA
jgi:hypothetical protein